MVKKSEEKNNDLRSKLWFAQLGTVPSSGAHQVCQFVSEHGWNIVAILHRGVQPASMGSVISAPQAPKMIEVCGIIISKLGTIENPPELPTKEFKFQV